MKNTQRLTDKELGQLGVLAVKYQSEQKITWIAALEKAQSELFTEEKRYTKGSLYAFSSKIRENIPKNDEIVVNPTVVDKTSTEIVQQEQPVKKHVVKPQPNPFPKLLAKQEVVAEQKQTPALGNFTFGSKITELASVLAKQFEDQLTSELEKALSSALSSVERSFEEKLSSARKTAGVGKAQLPRVMVVGIMGEVAYDISSEYGEILDLRFYKTEENFSLIRSQAKNCDYILLMTKFINHGHQDCVRDHSGLIFCNGGVTQMKEILLTLACK